MPPALTRALPLLFLSLACLTPLPASTRRAVSPSTLPETQRLLDDLHRLQGKGTLLGNHDYIGRLSEASKDLETLTERTLALWGSDWGFSAPPKDIDSLTQRPALLREVLRRHALGQVFTLTYHQGNPVHGEPCTFKEGVQSELSSAQWKELLSPGTPLHQAWLAQMDLLAAFLKELEKQKVTVLFRPYHEMNGGWFWWGKGDRTTEFIQLWNNLFQHYTQHHQLKNLIWVWACSNQVKHPPEAFFPGRDKVDLVSADIYPIRGQAETPEAIYSDTFYERLARIAGPLPMAIGEASVLPTPAILTRQQAWLWFMGWVDLPKNKNSEESLRRLFQTPVCFDLKAWNEFRSESREAASRAR